MTDWNPTTREQALANNNIMYVYCASKALAEKAINEIGEAHPDVSIAGSESYQGWVCYMTPDEEWEC
jgi:hypothetical protein